MHNGMLDFGGEKMSKSLGNDVSIRNVLDTWGREAVLLFFMTAHWRKPIDFGDGPLEQARAQLEGFRNVFRSPSEPVGDWADFEAALDDDFNTPEALAVLHGWRDHELLRRAFGIFGLDLSPSRRKRRPSSSRSPSSASRRARRRTSRSPIASATRSRPPAGACATSTAASSSSRT